MNPMITMILMAEKKLQMEQEQRKQHRYVPDVDLVQEWQPQPKKRRSLLAWLAKIRMTRRQTPCEGSLEPGC